MSYTCNLYHFISKTKLDVNQAKLALLRSVTFDGEAQVVIGAFKLVVSGRHAAQGFFSAQTRRKCPMALPGDPFVILYGKFRHRFNS